MLKKLLLLIGLLVYSQALSKNQIEDFKYSFNYGKKYGLGWTLAAISYTESSLGKYKVNLSDPSASSYHILIKSVLSRNEIPDNAWNRSRMLEKLIRNRKFAANQAIAELLYWKSYWLNRGCTENWLWIKMVSSYNAGSYLNLRYVRKVSNAIRILKKVNIKYKLGLK